MKGFVAVYLLASLTFATAFNWQLILGETLTKQFGLSDSAPSCNQDNNYCLIPDYDDPTIFYRCQSIGATAAKAQCLPGLNFVFSKQSCLSPSQWCQPPGPPARCVDIPLGCQATTTVSSTVSSTISTKDPMPTTPITTTGGTTVTASPPPTTTTRSTVVTTVPSQEPTVSTQPSTSTSARTTTTVTTSEGPATTTVSSTTVSSTTQPQTVPSASTTTVSYKNLSLNI